MTTTPTQAQIEAAMNTFSRYFADPWDAREVAIAALTAAAGVPDQEHILQKPGQKPGLLPNGNTDAEVGSDPDFVLTREGMDLLLKIERKATIECCAQVAENCELSDIDRDSPRTVIAAAIRALKNES